MTKTVQEVWVVVLELETEGLAVPQLCSELETHLEYQRSCLNNKQKIQDIVHGIESCVDGQGWTKLEGKLVTRGILC